MLKKGLILSTIFIIVSIIVSFTLLFISNSFKDSFSDDKSAIAFPTIISPMTMASTSPLENNLPKLTPNKQIGLFKKPAEKVNSLIACGTPLGIKFFTNGVLVVGIADITTNDGKISPAYNAGIRVRDIILKINGTEVNTNEKVQELISKSNGESLTFTVKRNISTFECNVVAVKSIDDGLLKLGMWVRDSTAGIGTITYFDPKTRKFGALGHGICDPDTSALMPLNSADVYFARINSVIKGEKGAPGELRGKFLEDSLLGNITTNSSCGIFGTTKQNIDGVLCPVGYKNEVQPGEAFIYCTVDEKPPQKYAIEISKISKVFDKEFRDMTIKITDSALLAKTGGIIQGMSGSPIIQNGKLIGAVTHVFINDPTSGYGIFIENMLNTAMAAQKAA
ncbi:MAG: SpoIVB peptidase [Clostridia bacterium]